MSSIRANSDYFFDASYIVSGQKDHYKHAAHATLSTASYTVCPIFPTMFSDMPNHPRKQFVRRRVLPPPTYVYNYMPKHRGHKTAERSASHDDVTGTQRFRFFDYRMDRVSTMAIPQIHIEHDRDHINDTRRENKMVKRSVKIEPAHKIPVQTLFRESDAQTLPWQPDYKVLDSGDPELLKLDFLKWGVGLPAGLHEVSLIQRARMKRCWANEMDISKGSNKPQQEREKIIAAMERDQWVFREKEIQHIQDLRLELLEQMLFELLERSAHRSELKMKQFCETKDKEKAEKRRKIRVQCEREKRRLYWNHCGILTRYRKPDIVEEIASRKSEAYAQIERHGNNPRYWHFNIKPGKYSSQFVGVDRMKVLPLKLDLYSRLRENEVRLEGTRVCVRETKWTNPVLKQLYNELKGIQGVVKRDRLALRTVIKKEFAEPPTPETDGIAEEEEEVFQASLVLEAVLRGRASQILIYEGRDRCKELIEELRSSHGVLEKDIQEKFENKLQVKQHQRTDEHCLRNINRVKEALKWLEGSVVGTLLDFLNKELIRLQDERKAHALCLMAERERQIREAAEAGRRQMEARRRLEHDEMFKQVVKVAQDNIDLYLQDIITEGMEFASVEEASNFVRNMAQQVDKDNEQKKKEVPDQTRCEDHVASLVHHFVLPEVQRKLVRERIKLQQAEQLRSAHDCIYAQFDHYTDPAKTPRKLAPPSSSAMSEVGDKSPPTKTERRTSSMPQLYVDDAGQSVPTSRENSVALTRHDQIARAIRRSIVYGVALTDPYLTFVDEDALPMNEYIDDTVCQMLIDAGMIIRNPAHTGSSQPNAAAPYKPRWHFISGGPETAPILGADDLIKAVEDRDKQSIVKFRDHDSSSTSDPSSSTQSSEMKASSRGSSVSTVSISRVRKNVPLSLEKMIAERAEQALRDAIS